MTLKITLTARLATKNLIFQTSKPTSHLTSYNTFTLFDLSHLSFAFLFNYHFPTFEKATKMSYGGGYGSSRGGGYGGASGGYSNGYDDYRSGGGYAGARDYSTTYSHGYDYPGLDVEV